MRGSQRRETRLSPGRGTELGSEVEVRHSRPGGARHLPPEYAFMFGPEASCEKKKQRRLQGMVKEV